MTNFRVDFCLRFKPSLHAKPFVLKCVSSARFHRNPTHFHINHFAATPTWPMQLVSMSLLKLLTKSTYWKIFAENINSTKRTILKVILNLHLSIHWDFRTAPSSVYETRKGHFIHSELPSSGWYVPAGH